MNNLEPRAKIGDVVIMVPHPNKLARLHRGEVEVGNYSKLKEWEKERPLCQVEIGDAYVVKDGRKKYWLYEDTEGLPFEEWYILKNLTTNVSYE